MAVERIREGLGKRKLQALMPLEIERFWSMSSESWVESPRLARPLLAVGGAVRSGSGGDLDVVDQAVAQLEPVAEIGLAAGEVP